MISYKIFSEYDEDRLSLVFWPMQYSNRNIYFARESSVLLTWQAGSGWSRLLIYYHPPNFGNALDPPLSFAFWDLEHMMKTNLKVRVPVMSTFEDNDSSTGYKYSPRLRTKN